VRHDSSGLRSRIFGDLLNDVGPVRGDAGVATAVTAAGAVGGSFL
jgi:hypothetical protein